jgi:thiol-disulfide isomerase/thioredoxin
MTLSRPVGAQNTVSAQTYWETIEKNVQTAFDSSIGKRAPDLVFQALNDTMFHCLKEFTGRVVLLNFWSRGCRPCIGEMPDLSVLQDDYRKAGLDVVMLGDDFDTQRRFFAVAPISGIKGRLVDRATNAFIYRTGVVPTSILVDQTGIIKDFWLGAIGYVGMEKRINTLIPRDQKTFRLRVTRRRLSITIACFGLFLISSALVWNVRRRKAALQIAPQRGPFGST